MQENNDFSIWQAQILLTLDDDYANAPIHLAKAKRLAKHLKKGRPCYLVLYSDLCVEIVNVVRVFHDIVTLERGLKGTQPRLWAAGSMLSAKISADMLKALQLSHEAFLKLDDRTVLTPEGDVITLLDQE